MNKKHIFIASLILLLFSIAYYKNLQAFEKESAKYKIAETKKKSEFGKHLQVHEVTNSSNKKSYPTKKPIFKFSSTSNDLEDETRILQTNNEISYHTFDFSKNLISFKSQTKNGKWKTFHYKIKTKKIKESLSGLKGMEFEIDHQICHQIWVSSLGNIGYEFKNGQKQVFYNVSKIAEKNTNKTEYSNILELVNNIEIYDKIPNRKLSLNIILSKRIGETELRKIGNILYRKYNGSEYENLFMTYYLNGMTIGNMGYATTHFRPNIEVRVYGLTKYMFEKIKNSGIDSKDYWIDDDWQSLATIRKINNKYELYRIAYDLSTASRELKMKVTKNKDTVYFDSGINRNVFYYKNKANQIEVRDKKGLIYKMLLK